MMTQPYFDNYLSQQILPSFQYICSLVAQDQDKSIADGVLAFNSKSEFVEGKVINAFSYLLVSKLGTSELNEWLDRFRTTCHFVASRKFETWGILNCLIGLYRLKRHNLLEQAVSAEDLAALQVRLTWHQFVDEADHFRLIGKPTNYYGVAFGIARYRELLNWSEKTYSDVFLDLLTTHIKNYSGKQMYMDETQGQGRFDRYSLLIPAEISNLLLETGRDVPGFLKSMLQQSVSVCLELANVHGNGIEYGRSIGAYGDTAILEILSVANRLHLLEGDDQALAFAFAGKIMQKFSNFWFNPSTHYVNMWDHGRQTDGYRNKNRILGETLMLQLQIMHSIENFESNNLPIDLCTINMPALLDKLPEYRVFAFDDHNGPKRLVIVRHHGHIFMIPFINGAEKYFKTSPYFPMPMATQFLEYSPDALSGGFLPIFTCNKTRLAPLANFTNITVSNTSAGIKVTFNLDPLCDLSGSAPILVRGYHYQGTYLFNDNGLQVSGSLHADNAKLPDTVSMELPFFSTPAAHTVTTVEFAENTPRTVNVTGFSPLSINSTVDLTQTPHGAHRCQIKLTQVLTKNPFQFSLSIRY